MHVCVSAVGSDRPGVIAALSGVLHERSCNIEDSSMTVLSGHFAMVLLVAVADGVATADLAAELAAAVNPLGIEVVVSEVSEEVAEEHPGEPWMLTLYGGDRPGIVHAVSAALAARRVNIDNLATRVIGSADQPVYTMVLELSVPDGVDAAELEADLARLATELKVDHTLRSAEPDVF